MFQRIVLSAFLPGVLSLACAASLDVQSTASEGSLGAVVRFSASTDSQDGSTILYRFRARRAGAQFTTIRDFGPNNVLDWTTIARDGDYEIEVTATDTVSGDTTVQRSSVRFTSLLQNGADTVSSTGHPLVFVFATPACKTGGRVRVLFQSDASPVTATPYQACAPAHDLNFYLVGMTPETVYHAHSELDTGQGVVSGTPIDFTTGSLPANVVFPTYQVSQAMNRNTTQPLLLHSPLSAPATATDLNGRVVWYYVGTISSLTRPSDGRFFGFLLDPSQDTSHQILREVDLAGITVHETNAKRVSDQLEAMGMRPITGFHHEVRALPGGGILALASTEQLMTGVQDPGTVDVLGDMIVALDNQLQVVWAWDAFQWLDPKRKATLNETCTPAGGGCPPFSLAPVANDWLHGNSLDLTADGNILYSARHQDWVIKINYDSGTGDGSILWRLGKDGDFTVTGDPYPWFSHQHDPGIIPGTNLLTVFDNGNLRYDADSSAHSRGQVLQLDETNRTATLMLNADVGAYSYALGSAHRLNDGNFHFDLGIIRPANTARSVEVNQQGAIVYGLDAASAEYRTFRLRDLYSNGY
jgi:arylsulfate sulfotransferase